MDQSTQTVAAEYWIFSVKELFMQQTSCFISDIFIFLDMLNAQVYYWL